ncbi:hypothetical protein V493_07905, partial [Pseudogymnoascus sp. VKM F-4281 (FW-2241)]
EGGGKKRKVLVPVGKSKGGMKKMSKTKKTKKMSKPGKTIEKAKKVANKMGKVGAGRDADAVTTTNATTKKSPKKLQSPATKTPKSNKGLLKQTKLSFGKERLGVSAIPDADAASPTEKKTAAKAPKAPKAKKSGVVVVKRRGTKVVMKKGVRGETKTKTGKKVGRPRKIVVDVDAVAV